MRTRSRISRECVSCFMGLSFGSDDDVWRPTATSREMMLLRQVTPMASSFGPAWLRRWLLENVPIAGMQRLAQICDTLHLKASEILRDKKAAVRTESNVVGKDIMSILCKWAHSLMTLRRPSRGSRKRCSGSQRGSIERGRVAR